MERLAEGIRRANAAGDGNAVRVLGARYREMQAQPPTRPTFPSTGSTEEFNANVGRIGSALLRTTGHNLLPSLVDQETPEQGALFDDMMSDVAMTMAGAGIGGAGSRVVSDALKYLGRGGRTERGAGSFLRREAADVVPEGQAAETGVARGVGKLLAPPVAGSAIGYGTSALMDPADNLGGGEFGDAIVGGGAGLGATGLVARNTIDDLMVTNPRWRKVITRPSRGTAGTLLGALLGYLTSRGIEAGSGLANDAADYVAGLFEQEEQPR